MPTKKTTIKKTTEARQSTNGPDFIAYTIIDRGEDEKAVWRPIGSAWMHEDGNGLQVRLDAFPLSGTVTLRVPLPKE